MEKFSISSNNDIDQVQFMVDYLLLDRSTEKYTSEALTNSPHYEGLVDFLVDLEEVKLATGVLFPNF
jgi:hypothetical protein